MKIIQKIFQLIVNPKRFIVALSSRGWLWMPDTLYLKVLFQLRMGYSLDIKNPRTFNEKLQWLKLYNRKPEYTMMVDKYAVKKYVADKIGEEYIIPTLGVWDKPEDIDFDHLPNQFVLKCTHDSGTIIICKDKSRFNIVNAKTKLRKCLKRNFFFAGREWPYKNVPHRIIAEPYMIDVASGELRDYKFFCFDGEIKCFKIDFDRYTAHHANYYDSKGNLLHFGEQKYMPDFKRAIDVPKNFELMKKFAKLFSQNIPFLRVDFYEINGKIYFGELTFYPADGFGKFIPEDWDKKLGEYIKI